MPARIVKAATDTAFQNCDCLDSITGPPLAYMPTQSAIAPHTAKKALRQGNSMKGDFIEDDAVSFTPAKYDVSRYYALFLDRILERSGQCAGVEGS